jgi:hypothetical protein
MTRDWGSDKATCSTATQPASARRSLPSDSIYAPLHRERDQLFPDEMFVELFTGCGRRSLPPSGLSGHQRGLGLVPNGLFGTSHLGALDLGWFGTMPENDPPLKPAHQGEQGDPNQTQIEDQTEHACQVQILG